MARENGSAATKKFTVGLIQMRSTANGDENRSRAAEKVREAANARRANYLHRRIVWLRIFLPRRKCGFIRASREHSWSNDGNTRSGGKRKVRGVSGFRV